MLNLIINCVILYLKIKREIKFIEIFLLFFIYNLVVLGMLIGIVCFKRLPLFSRAYQKLLKIYKVSLLLVFMYYFLYFYVFVVFFLIFFYFCCVLLVINSIFYLFTSVHILLYFFIVLILIYKLFPVNAVDIFCYILLGLILVIFLLAYKIYSYKFIYH